MPIYEYKYVESQESKSCDYCKNVFEVIQKAKEAPLSTCPQCGSLVKKIISRFGVSRNVDSKLKDSGFHKLVRKDKGTYEKAY